MQTNWAIEMFSKVPIFNMPCKVWSNLYSVKFISLKGGSPDESVHM